MPAELRLEEDTQPLLRPHQVEEMREEVQRLGEMLDPNAPEAVRASPMDRAEAVRQMRKLRRQLSASTPEPYPTADLDKAVAYERELRERFTDGMPTSTEMRRNPPGAVDKHRAWERRHKDTILRWKNVRLRLHASGYGDDVRDARDVANVERFRPAGGAMAELPMDGAQIPQKRAMHGLDSFIPKGMMSEQEREAFQAETRLFMEALAISDPVARAKALAFLRGEASGEDVPAGIAQARQAAASSPKK